VRETRVNTGEKVGGPGRDRTDDLFHAIQPILVFSILTRPRWLRKSLQVRENVRTGVSQNVFSAYQGELHKLGEDVSEMLEYVPPSFVVIRHVRTKLSCTKCDCIVQAEAPSRPIARGVAGLGLLAHVLVSKYCDHLRCIGNRRCMRVRMWNWSWLDASGLGRRKRTVAGTAGGSAAPLGDGRE